jgi:N-glycosylase/DNA lyase
MRDDPGDMDLRTILDWDYYLSVWVRLFRNWSRFLRRCKGPKSGAQSRASRMATAKNQCQRWQAKQKKMTDLFDKTPSRTYLRIPWIIGCQQISKTLALLNCQRRRTD